MNKLFKTGLKIFIFCFLVVNLQLSIIPLLSFPSFNFAFAAILASSILLTSLESFVLATLLAAMSSMLVYDNSIFWLYPVIAVIANKINPPQINNKIFVLLVYCFIFTPALEIFNPSKAGYFINASTAIALNLVASLVMYWVISLTLKDSSNKQLKFKL